MKKHFCIFAIFILILFISCNKPTDNALNVYCYDSFTGDWGPGNQIVQDFEKETGIKVNLISCAGSVQLYSKIIYEGKQCNADVVIGLPDSIEIDQSLFYEWTPQCKKDLIQYQGNILIPFDYGIFSFNYNKDSNIDIPTSIFELTNSQYNKKIILIDPRTSAVGLGLLKWTYFVLGEQFNTWWESILDNALTVTDSWSSAYGLFTEGEAPMVISYSTSPVYHIMNENNDKYTALNFKEGHIISPEYLAILNSSNKKDQAVEFCNYLLTKGQSAIAVANTMYPANTQTELPEAYNTISNPQILKVDDSAFIEILDEVLNSWTELAVK